MTCLMNKMNHFECIEHQIAQFSDVEIAWNFLFWGVENVEILVQKTWNFF